MVFRNDMSTASGPLDVAVVGLGIGSKHLDALAEMPEAFRVSALCDLDDTRLQREAARFPQALATKDLQQVLQSRPALLALCTPPHLHRAQIEACFDAGLPVVCEKPLVASLQEFDAVMQAQQRSGVPLFPIFQSRFGAGLQRVKHLQAHGLAQHALMATVETHWQRGAAYYATRWRGRWSTEKGGVCLTQAIHAHDMLTHVLGPIDSVFAHLATRVNDIEVDDCAAVSLRLKSGALATLSATLGAADNRSRLVFVFDDLTVTSDSPNAYRPALAPWHVQGKTPQVEAAIAAAMRSFVPAEESFVGQYRTLHDALRHGKPSPVTLGEARAALELVTAIYHSASTGMPATLPIAAGHPRYDDWTPTAAACPKGLAAPVLR